MNDVKRPEFAPAVAPQEGLIASASTREVAEIQSAMTIAQARPRDLNASVDRIMAACSREGLAEKAIYSYSRGGTDITGPSIRLAEMLGSNYGNITYGIRELEQKRGSSTVEAFAWDLETNVKATNVFQIAHKRHTRNGSYDLSDSRDIYELVANNGARRLRACLLKIIPSDITEMAVHACAETMRANIEITPELLNKLLDSFAEYDVTRAQIEKRFQRKLSAITPGIVVQLRNIILSLKDGMGVPGDWFDVDTAQLEDKKPESGAAEQAKAKLKSKAKGKTKAKAKAKAMTTEEEEEANAREDWIQFVSEALLKLSDAEQKTVVDKYLGGNVEKATLAQLRECGLKLEKL